VLCEACRRIWAEGRAHSWSSLPGMFTRIRWFAIGSAATLGATAFVVNRARVMKEQLTPDGVARASATLAADTIETLGVRLQRSALREVPNETEPDAG
jgi:hypothetical protein